MVSMRWCNVNYVGYSTKLCGKPFSSLINREYHIASNSDVQKKVLIGPYVPLKLMKVQSKRKEDTTANICLMPSILFQELG